MKAKPVRLALLDRDGVLNVDKAYLHEISKLQWVDQAKEAVALLTRAGYRVVVVTNQSGIARGYYTEADMHRLHEYMAAEVAKVGGCIEHFYFCPHLPEGSVAEYAVECDCRKPKPGMVLQALADYRADRATSFMVGDGKRDVEAAEAAGIKGYLFKGGNLLELVKQILAGAVKDGIQ